MREILALLLKSHIVKNVDVHRFIEEDMLTILHLKATIVDDSLLIIREVITPGSDKYSYHWQKGDGSLIMRWDNAEHYRHIDTFPHHIHRGNEILRSKNPTVLNVLETIEKELNPADQ